MILNGGSIYHLSREIAYNKVEVKMETHINRDEKGPIDDSWIGTTTPGKSRPNSNVNKQATIHFQICRTEPQHRM